MKIKSKKRFLFFGKEKHKIIDWNVKANPVVKLLTKLNSIKNLVVEFSGGGIKGIMCVYHNYVLFRDAEVLQDVLNKLKEVWGCSTGAIVGGLWLIGIAKLKNKKKFKWVEDNLHNFKGILRWYIEDATQVFKSNFLGGGFWSSIYDVKPIEKLLKEKFRDVSMKQLYEMTGILFNVRVVNVTDNKPMVINAHTHPHYDVWAVIRMSMSAPVFFKAYDYEGFVWADGGCGQYGVNVIPAYHKCIIENKWNCRDFFLLSWGTGREMIGQIGKDKIDALKWYLKYRTEEIEIETRRKLRRWEKKWSLKQFRWNIDLPKELCAMDKTDNIDEMIKLVDK